MTIFRTRSLLAAAAAATLVAQLPLIDQRQAEARQPPPSQPMSFFVTSVGAGDGANLGGLAGADRHCQKLAAAAGAGGKAWRAYLSTQGPMAVNARDRIGKGPWFNAKGARIAQDVADLHGDTLEQARRGNNVTEQTVITEQGQPAHGVNDNPNWHDVLTGSQLDGTAFPADEDRTCRNWTSNTADRAQVGHLDRTGGGNMSWNSTHASTGCSQTNLGRSGGRLYCFAID